MKKTTGNLNAISSQNQPLAGQGYGAQMTKEQQMILMQQLQKKQTAPQQNAMG
jgi:hypothetical protein